MLVVYKYYRKYLDILVYYYLVFFIFFLFLVVGLLDVMLLFLMIIWLMILLIGDKINKYFKIKKKFGFDSLILVIIFVGCVFLCLFVLIGVLWILKFIWKNCIEFVNVEDNDIYRLEIVYMEINVEFD